MNVCIYLAALYFHLARSYAHKYKGIMINAVCSLAVGRGAASLQIGFAGPTATLIDRAIRAESNSGIPQSFAISLNSHKKTFSLPFLMYIFVGLFVA